MTIEDYVNHLQTSPFEGWSEDSINGYLTACTSILEFINRANGHTDVSATPFFQTFNPKDYKTFPNKYGKYLVQHRDGTTHETIWNNNSWAYQHSQVQAYRKIEGQTYC